MAANLAKQRVLVTGASGLLGSAIANQIMDSGTLLSLQVRDLQRISPKLSDCNILEFNVENKGEIIIEEGTSCVVHTATANESKTDNLERAIATTFNGTLNMIEQSLKIGVKKFIYISTTQVYAESAKILTEKSAIKPKSNYALQHYLTEQLVHYYSPKFEQGAKVLRVANVFSGSLTALQNRSNLVPTSFIVEALESGKISLKTSGIQNRSFISDISVGSICLDIIRSKIGGFQIINVGSYFQPSILEVANLVSATLKNFDKEVRVIANKNQIPEKSRYQLSSKVIEFKPAFDQEVLFQEAIQNLIILRLGEM